MPFVITDACRGCKHARCVDSCPCDSIHPTPDEEGFDAVEQLFIDPDTCIECGMCAGECPEQAIFADVDLPDDKHPFIAINAAHFAEA